MAAGVDRDTDISACVEIVTIRADFASGGIREVSLAVGVGCDWGGVGRSGIESANGDLSCGDDALPLRELVARVAASALVLGGGSQAQRIDRHASLCCQVEEKGSETGLASGILG